MRDMRKNYFKPIFSPSHVVKDFEKPFPQESELRTKSARLAELDAELNMDRQSEKEQPQKEEHER